MDWNNVVSMVATSEGLLVTERGADGQVGAYPVQKLLKALQPGKQTNAAFGCTDAMAKTYRVSTSAKPKPQPYYFVEQITYPLFKACSDADALTLAFPPFHIQDEAYCKRLERLDAKPGMVSQWVLVKSSC